MFVTKNEQTSIHYNITHTAKTKKPVYIIHWLSKPPLLQTQIRQLLRHYLH